MENKNKVQEALDKYRKTKKAYLSDEDKTLPFDKLAPLDKDNKGKFPSK